VIRTHQNYRVECAGKNVQLFRYPNLDVTVTRWKRKTYVDVYLHGKLADEPLWIRVRSSDGALWDVDSRDADTFLVRDPKAQIVPASPAPSAWSVIAEKVRDVNELTAEDCVWLWSQGIGV
jgi:hypothetical protein